MTDANSKPLYAVRTGLVAVRWLIVRVTTFLAICGAAVLVAFLRAGMQPQQHALPMFGWYAYRAAIEQFLEHLRHGTFGFLYYQPAPGRGVPIRTPAKITIDEIIARSIPETLTLFAGSLIVGILVGLLVGYLASRFSPRWVRGLALGANMAALSLPEVVLVVAVQFGIVSLWRAMGFDTAPSLATHVGEMTWRQLILPVVMLSFFPAAYAARFAVAAFDEIWQEDYIRTARSKGVTHWRLTWQHAMRNALIPLLGALPMISGLMISNLIMIEYLTNTLGLGWVLAYELMGDRLQGGAASLPSPSPNLLASILICFGTLFMVVDGCSDLLLRWLDPRVRDAHRESSRARRRLNWRDWLDWRVDWRALAGSWAGFRESLRGPNLRAGARSVVRAYRGNPALMFGSLILLVLIGAAIFAPWLARANPTEVKLFNLYGGKRGFLPPFPPSPQFPLGSDSLGRDLLSVILYGTRYTLLIAAVVVPLRMLVAIPLGLAAGRLRGFWEHLVKWMATVMGALPSLLIPALLLPVLYPLSVRGQGWATLPNKYTVLLVHAAILMVVGIPRLAESVRIMTLELETRPFVEGAVAAGATPWRIMRRHILPHLKPQIAITFAAEMAAVMLLMAQLAAFEIWVGGAHWDTGIAAPNFPDWSTLLGRPHRYILVKQWVVVVPSAAFFVGIFGFTLLSEGLRRAQRRA